MLSDEYIERVGAFIRYLRPETVIQGLRQGLKGAFATGAWTTARVVQAEKYLESMDIYQGWILITFRLFCGGLD